MTEFLLGMVAGCVLTFIFCVIFGEEEKDEPVYMKPIIHEEKGEVITICATTEFPYAQDRLAYEYLWDLAESNLIEGLGKEAFRYADVRQIREPTHGSNIIEAKAQIVARKGFNPFLKVDTSRSFNRECT